MLRTFSPNAQPAEVGAAVSYLLGNGEPYVHATGLRFAEMGPTERDEYIREAAGAIGEITLTNGVPGTGLWLLDSATSPNADYVPFHTDNPFLERPEGVVGFWNLVSSPDGGENLVLPIGRLAGHGMLDYLSKVEQSVLFRHKDKSHDGPMVEYGDGGDILVRFDPKYSGRQADSGLVHMFRTLLESRSKAGDSDAIKLAPGDALFFDNLRSVHARTPYRDVNRRSIRTRSIRR